MKVLHFEVEASGDLKVTPKPLCSHHTRSDFCPCNAIFHHLGPPSTWVTNPGHLLCRGQSSRGLTQASKTGCDFLSIWAQAPVWVRLLRKACSIHLYMSRAAVSVPGMPPAQAKTCSRHYRQSSPLFRIGPMNNSATTSNLLSSQEGERQGSLRNGA